MNIHKTLIELIDYVAETYPHVTFFIDDDDNDRILAHDTREDFYYGYGMDFAHFLDVFSVPSQMHSSLFRLLMAAFNNIEYPKDTNMFTKVSKLREYIIKTLVKDSEKPKICFEETNFNYNDLVVIDTPSERVDYHTDIKSYIERAKLILSEHPQLLHILLQALSEALNIPISIGDPPTLIAGNITTSQTTPPRSHRYV